MKEKGHKLHTLARILIPVLVLWLGWLGYKHFFPERVVTVGFIYDNDETAPYSYNFYLAQEAVQKAYQNKVRTVMCSNVLDEHIHLSVQKLVDGKCDIIFTNSYGNIRDLAVKYPHIQFCQASFDPKPKKAPANYHTFKGEAYQGRYVSGVVAGLKMEEMIKKGIQLNPQIRTDKEQSDLTINQRLLKKALEKHTGKRKDAAKELGISERTLYRKINEFGIS